MANLRTSGVFNLGALGGNRAASGDANWSDVTLLLDGSSPTTDLSSQNQSSLITNNNSVSTTSLAGPSGHGTVTALDFNGSTQYLTSNHYTASLYNQDFTIEGWYYIDSAATSVQSFFSHRAGNSSDSVIPYIASGSTYGFVVGNGSWVINTTGGTATNGWHHIALTRSGNDYVMWVDGVSTLTGTSSATVSTSGNFAIAVGMSVSVSQYFKGKVFDFRVTEGVARDIATDWADGVYSGALPQGLPAAGATRPTRKWGGMLGRTLTTDVDKAPVVDHSLRFDGSGDYLTRSQTTPTDPKKFTWSGWVKNLGGTAEQSLLSARTTSTNQALVQLINGRFGVRRWSGTTNIPNAYTDQTFTDPTVWNHFVLEYDSTVQSVKIWVNGQLESPLKDAFGGTAVPPSLNQTISLHDGSEDHYVGARGQLSYWFKGQMAEVHFVDGQALDASYFGETNASGQWVPKEVTGVTYGNNGFHLPLSTPSSTTNAFNAVTYSGTRGTHAVTGVAFQPDFVWLKSRTNTYVSGLFDTVRGGGNHLCSSLTNGNITQDANGYLDSFDADGFTLIENPSNTGVAQTWNDTGQDYIAWTWKAGGAPTSNGTAMVDGEATTTSSIASAASASITPQKMSVNTEAGFSIVSYDGVSTAGTVPHGLDQAPEMVIIKCTDFTGSSWNTYSATTGASQKLFLNEPNQAASTSLFNNTAPTSNVFSIYSPTTNPETNKVGHNFIAYCWHSVPGYSKIGSYTGSGGAGNKITTGFQPAFVMIKNVTTSGNDWHIIDNTRDETNVRSARLKANTADIENSSDNALNFLADGFDHYGSSGARNASGNTYIYMAFADTSPNLGLDATTNTNNFAVNGAITPDDQLLDTPNLRFAALDPANSNSDVTFAEGNLRYSPSTTQYRVALHTLPIPENGKVYVEVMGGVEAATSNRYLGGIGFTSSLPPAGTVLGDQYGWEVYTNANQIKIRHSSLDNVFSNTAFSDANYATNVFMLALDRSGDGAFYFGLNGQWIGSLGTNGTLTSSFGSALNLRPELSTQTVIPTGTLYMGSGVYKNANDNYSGHLNFGQDHTFSGLKSPLSSPYTDSDGNGEFYYQPPAGFRALTTKIVGSDTVLQSTGVISLAEHYQTKLPQ